MKLHSLVPQTEDNQYPLFKFDLAFSRTLGFVTRDELLALQGKKVAIAGLGGVGGGHLLTLVRLGIGNFHIADFDIFGVENFNRQAGANIATIGRKKIEVMSDAAKLINPDLKINCFLEGVTESNIDRFFDGVDLYVDALDFFAFEARSQVFKFCHERKIPAITVAPIGMGAALLNFIPGKMSFHDYFQWKESDSEIQLAVKFLLGLTPALPQSKYLVDRSYVNFKERKGPSTPMACELCAGIAGTEALKILLRRGPVQSAPKSIHFDAYQNRLYSRWIPFGNKNPLQLLKIALTIRQFGRK